MSICGRVVYLRETGQYHMCTVKDVHPNHDMPGPDGTVQTPHRSGPRQWSTRYPQIGPEIEYAPDDDE